MLHFADLGQLAPAVARGGAPINSPFVDAPTVLQSEVPKRDEVQKLAGVIPGVPEPPLAKVGAEAALADANSDHRRAGDTV